MMLNYSYKILGFVYFLFSYFSTSILILIFNQLNIDKARPQLIRNISSHSRLAIRILGIKVNVKHFDKLHGKNFLIVSNHLSYMDIFVISSFIPTCFVTSYEMKETPFLGQVCTLGGCLFVERRSKKGIKKEINSLSHSLKKKLNVTIFPEAKSGSGEGLLKFRSPLYQAAIDSQVDVLPICINYKKMNGELVSLKNRDKLFWYGEMTFFPHFFKLMALKKIEVDLDVLCPISSTDKVILLNESFEQIRGKYKEIT